MPELPEVETTLRGLAPHLHHAHIENIVIRHPRLRWPIPTDLPEKLSGQIINSLSRRGKYLLFHLTRGTLIIHLGMSGRLRLLTRNTPPQKHDHLDINFSDGICLRYTDPRRFGAILWTEDAPSAHPLLKKLGVEPLTRAFTAEYLFAIAIKRRVAMKSLLMSSKVVVGIGNIYANEALFRARIHPRMSANQLTLNKAQQLIEYVQQILNAAIEAGGTTLKDFVNSQGKPGYFTQHLQVYGRGGQPCFTCAEPLQSIVLGQRTTIFCPKCQKE